MSLVRPRTPPGKSVSRYRVLLVDDDATVLRGLAAALEFDLDVTTCLSGERALKMLEEQEFHAVCCDYSMPGMNGLELFDRVARSKLPVACLLLTGSMAFIDRAVGATPTCCSSRSIPCAYPRCCGSWPEPWR